MMWQRRITSNKIAIIIISILMLSLPLCAPTSATDPSTIRQAGMEYAKYGEEVMVDGPFYLGERPYWTLDYVKRGEAQASLVYDPSIGQFVTNDFIMRRVFAVKEFKNITAVDPLFYAVGDPTAIALGAQYQTQNIRNFAAFAPLTEDENAALERFLADYEKTAQDMVECIRLTNSLLRPGVTIKVNYEDYPLNLLIETQSTEDHFSYEGCQQLVDAYDAVYADYSKLVPDLDGFVGSVEDIPPGTVIREKWGVKITKESILEEVDLVSTNGQTMKTEIDLRKGILNGDYADQIATARDRLQIKDTLSLKVGVILAALIIILVLRYLRKRQKFLPVLLATMILLTFAAPAMSIVIPSPEELLSQKVTDPSQVSIQIFAKGMDNEMARDVVEGYPLILKGEEVYVSGPYYHEGQAYYLFDIVDDGVPTGDLLFADAITLRKVGSYRIVDRLMKTFFLNGMVRQRPLYQNVDPNLLEDEAMRTNESSVAVFLVRLAENVREGKELEQSLIITPDFETARDLARQYKRASILLQKMEQLMSSDEAERITHDFSTEATWLEAYALVMQYTVTDDYLKVCQARYRGRSLNRIPMMQELEAAGLSPSKLQVVHDLNTDLIYGSPFLWRLGKMESPLFVSMPRKMGEFSLPSMPGGA